MKDQAHNNSSSRLLKTDGGKTKSNAIEVPSISLPKGGGAIKGIDEKFSVNAVNGTASFSIPLPFSPARGASPALSISYNSGSGNGIFGLGWSLGLASVKRSSQTKLPQYIDATDSDSFAFSDAEDLVPEFKKDSDGSFSLDAKGEYIIREKLSDDGVHTIRFYKPRIEGQFARIERWINNASRMIKWRIITRDNVTTLFGWTSDSVIADPNDKTKIFEWLPEFVFDDKGNCSRYVYKRENAIDVPDSLHNRNRFVNGNITYTNLYMEKVLYGNKTPYKKFGDAIPGEADYLFETVFDYGEYNTNSPYAKVKEWDHRPDAFSDYRAGFEIRTTRLCKRVLLFHHFIELPGGSALTRSLDFDYDTAAEPGFTFLKSVTSMGYIKKANGSYTSKRLPPIEYEYQKHEWNKEVKTISTENIVHAPAGLDERLYQFTDLYNEGLPGILSEQASGWFYKHNLGDGKFEHAKLVSPKPSFSGLGTELQLVDLDADGGRQVVSFNQKHSGYFELDDNNDWQPFKPFESLPNINFGNANTRMVDLNGDGRSEVLVTEEDVFSWYKSEGREGFSQVCTTVKTFDEEAGPHIAFSDATQTIYLADMSGDGLADIVRIRNGEVCYWPNLGYGKFGTKVAMNNVPYFDFTDRFDPALIRLADIDGSGTTDIIYLGKNKVTCWMNLSGNTFATIPFEVDALPGVNNVSGITVTDLLGNGVACIVWSGSLSKDSNEPLKYIDLMNSKKPHIMVSYKNNLGKEVSLEYTPSTKFYIEDKFSGKPWITKLHFPVHCISRTETLDKITGHRFVSSYKYHHGYYDHAEREFRGFGMVEQTDAEHFEHWEKGDATNIVDKELHQEPVVSKSWFHTGAFLRGDKISSRFADEYWYNEMARQGFTTVHHEMPLPEAPIIPAPGLDGTMIDQLGTDELMEAVRACKGMMLRSEIFAYDAREGASDDDKRKQLTPYSVATHSCVIELLQPKGNNEHAIFRVKQSEDISYSYERNADDPRIAHNLVVKSDEYGNVLESASVVYPRILSDTLLPPETQLEQSKTVVIYTNSQFTNDVIDEDIYRLRLQSEVKTFELKGLVPTSLFYSVSDFDDILAAANEVAYHELSSNPAPGSIQKRLIEHNRTNFYNNDLKAPLLLHQLESLALPYESYQLAYTTELLTDIYGTKVGSALMTEGRFVNSEGDNNWWVRSGTTQFIENAETSSNAQDRFYTPLSYTDPYGAKTHIKYYSDYFLFIEETKDYFGNTSKTDLINFRTLTARKMRDINNNVSEVIVDELGLVKAMAITGKEGDNDGISGEADDLAGIAESTEATEMDMINSFLDADDPVLLTALAKNLLQHATAYFVYDFDVYRRTGKPAVVASVIREEHFRKNNNAPVQLGFEYSNGLGSVVMNKVQAEPGMAKTVNINPGNTYTITDVDTSALNPKQLRWIGNGRTVLNNKGKPVKKYEPYFSVTHKYEDQKELVETGVTPVMFYDATGRLVKTNMPDETLRRTEFDSWKEIVFDANDTVLESSWFRNRTNRLIDDQLIARGKDPAKEKIGADKAAKHANTPAVLHFDTLGRPVLSIDHNKNSITDADEFNRTKINLDTEGNLRSVFDTRELPENGNRGNTVMQYKYDMLGNLVYQNSMDAGQSWLLINVTGNSLRTWDERNHEFQYFYDELQRPLHSRITGGDGSSPLDHIFDKIIYGESLLLPGRSNEADLQVSNILGRPIRHFDTGGVVLTPHYDFKGQPLSITRRLFKNYKSVANWTDAGMADDLESDLFTFITETDALGRVTKQTAPDASIITPSYNEAGLLNGETVIHANPALTTTYIKDIDYNEKRQRNKIIYGNDVSTKFYYDSETFRLNRLETKRQTGPLQDWYYTYDPVGNITHIEDKNIPVIFFDNQKITGGSEYSYDALYRLVEATGRENNAALNFDNKDNWSDAAYMHQLNPGDPMAIRNYVQRYQYDKAGNIREMNHQSAGNNWSRSYEYELLNNRLKSTKVGEGANAFTYLYPHHPQHGFITAMPHLEDLEWNFKEELIRTVRQKVNPGNGTAETTYYQYDGGGQRIRKITENSAVVNADPTKKEERIYIAGYETYRTYQANSINFERESLSLMDEDHRFVIIETVKQNTNPSPPSAESIGVRLIRYQLHNHLSSASLELDATAQVISYEEYHPFGTTAYQAKSASIKAAAKRYRFTGMERDEESGLEYHSARYYLAWLGRWLSADPIGIKEDLNVFAYVKLNPIRFLDKSGLGIGDWFYENVLEPTADFIEEHGIDDAVAGFGDTVSFGLTKKVRQAGDFDSSIDYDSTAYTVGEVAGYAHGLVTGGVGVARTAAKYGVKTTLKATGTVIAGTTAAVKVADTIDPSGWTSAIILNVVSYLLPLASRLGIRRDPATKAAGARLSNVVRTGGPSGGGKSIAAAEVDVPGYSGRSTTLRARSGNGTPTPSQQTVPHSPPPANRTLTTSRVSDAPGEHQHSRAVDAEIKIFEEVQAGLPPNAQGTVNLASSNPMCPSCTTAAFEFAGNNPGIRLGIFAPSRRAPSISLFPALKDVLPAAGLLGGRVGTFIDTGNGVIYQENDTTVLKSDEDVVQPVIVIQGRF